MSKKPKKKKTPRKPWTPFERAVANPQSGLGQLGIDVVKDAFDEIWKNSHYQVCLKRIPAPPGWPCDMVHLSIKRLDKHPIHDWRHFQWIKNELVGEENEAIEIYPAESRLVDTSNQYHLWVFSSSEVRIPLGFGERAVWEGDVAGAKQRDWPPEKRPSDAISPSEADIRQMAATSRSV